MRKAAHALLLRELHGDLFILSDITAASITTSHPSRDGAQVGVALAKNLLVRYH